MPGWSCLPPVLVTLGFCAGWGQALAWTGFNTIQSLPFPRDLSVGAGGAVVREFRGAAEIGRIAHVVGLAVLSAIASRGMELLDSGGLLSVLTYRGFALRAGLPERFEAMQGGFPPCLAGRRSRRFNPSRRCRWRVERGQVPMRPSRTTNPRSNRRPIWLRSGKAVEEVDAILDKIARSGMDSLTAAEKAALQKASSRLKDTDS